MEKIFEVTVSEEYPTLRDFLRRAGFSYSLTKEAKRGSILLNGEPVTVRATVRAGDRVEVYVKERKSEGITPIDIPLTVLYEDEDILAVDKPVNMPTHPSKGNNLLTLANAVMAYFGGDFVFRSVNRLDRDTSGIVIIAKNQISAGEMSKSMKAGLWQKEYEALVVGRPTPMAGVIDEPIERVAEGNIKREVRADGKRAVTEYRVVEERGENSLCRIALKTGRTHQIRVHMAHIGHPLVSDFLYGKLTDEAYYLRCKKITFPHPKSNELITVLA